MFASTLKHIPLSWVQPGNEHANRQLNTGVLCFSDEPQKTFTSKRCQIYLTRTFIKCMTIQFPESVWSILIYLPWFAPCSSVSCCIPVCVLLEVVADVSDSQRKRSHRASAALIYLIGSINELSWSYSAQSCFAILFFRYWAVKLCVFAVNVFVQLSSCL